MASAAEPQTDPIVTVHEPGLVHIRAALTQSQQEWLAEIALEEGEHKGGFYEDGQLNSTRSRGRIYDCLQRFPAGLADVCKAQVARACREDQGMPAMTPTHLLLLKYTTERGLGFHRDIGENDGAGDFPVVSLSVGNSCTFCLKHERDAPHTEVLLMSGDAVLFGGPCRQILHSVTEVHPNTAPSWLPPYFRNARLNFTFRHAPEILGREKTFEFFRHDKGATPSDSIVVPQIEDPRLGKPRRLAHDGKPYTQHEFVEWYGEKWQQQWEQAAPGPAAAAKVSKAEADQILTAATQSASQLGNTFQPVAEAESEPQKRQRWRVIPAKQS